MLRLSLSFVPESDPGLYQTIATVLDFKRACHRCHGFVHEWSLFLSGFSGRLFQGPGSKLLQVSAQLGWHWLSAQCFVDEEGLTHYFLECPESLLRQLLLRAWMQFVAHKHRCRQTMKDMHSIDYQVTCAGIKHLNALDFSRQSALNSGAFMFNNMQHKFDKSKTEQCVLCKQVDDARHRVCVCPRFAHARQGHEWIVDQWDALPDCLTHHLIAPMNPFAKDLRQQLHGLSDNTASFYSRLTVDGLQHVFTDGSCFWPEHPDVAVASWAVIHAGTGMVLSSAPLQGILQTISRAELTAVISACQWIASVRRPAVIWSDSKFVCDGFADILAGGQASQTWDNADLWAQLREVLTCIPADEVLVRHVPGHLDKAACDSPFEEWVAEWNARADLQAKIANRNRGQRFVYAHDSAMRWQANMLRCIRTLRNIYFSIADSTKQSAVQDDPAEDMLLTELRGPSQVFVHPGQRISEHVPVGWRQVLRRTACRVPLSFICALLELLWQQDESSLEVYEVSWLELLFSLPHFAGSSLGFPVVCPHTGGWTSAGTSLFQDAPSTVAVQLRLVKEAIRFALDLLGLNFCLRSGLNRTEIGVCLPLDGIAIGYDAFILCKARSDLSDWTVARPIRSAADYARPMPWAGK